MRLIIPFTIFIIILTTLLSCSKEYAYDFLEQPANGKISGVAWNFEIGKVIESDSAYHFSLYNEPVISICDSFITVNHVVVFDIPKPIILQTYILDFSLKTYEGTYVLLQNNAENLTTTVIEGAIEISTQDSLNNFTGKMDICLDRQNYINGSFEATYCD